MGIERPAPPTHAWRHPHGDAGISTGETWIISSLFAAVKRTSLDRTLWYRVPHLVEERT